MISNHFPPQRVTLITLSTADLSRAKNYYQQLGWRVSDETDDIAFFDLQGQKFALYKRTRLEADLGQPVAPSTGAIALTQNFDSPAHVDAAHAEALNAGAREIQAPADVFWGGYSATHADLDGHLWEYAYNPFWSLDDQGHLLP